jgi:nucleotide-binding universal stress UspA family protein
MIKSRIVVGVDGSAQAPAVVAWAAAEARRRGAELRVVTAYQRDSAGDRATEILRHAVARAHAVAPDVEVRCLALPGYAVPMLLHAAEEAALLVVGSRRTAGLPGLPSGSVGSQVATRARSSVVVVRGRVEPEHGPVVAGLDDGVAAPVVAVHAFEEASLHGAEVEAVTVRAAVPAEEPLLDDLDVWREKFPGVQAHHELVAGRPDRVLVQRSRSARLIVVGPRAHGFEGLMLGPIGSRLLERSGCPVFIARAQGRSVDHPGPRSSLRADPGPPPR